MSKSSAADDALAALEKELGGLSVGDAGGFGGGEIEPDDDASTRTAVRYGARRRPAVRRRRPGGFNRGPRRAGALGGDGAALIAYLEQTAAARGRERRARPGAPRECAAARGAARPLGRGRGAGDERGGGRRRGGRRRRAGGRAAAAALRRESGERREPAAARRVAARRPRRGGDARGDVGSVDARARRGGQPSGGAGGGRAERRG